MMMPDLVLVSAVIGLSSSRSCNGLNFMVFPLSGTGAAYRKRQRRVSTRPAAHLAALELGGGRGVERHGEPGDVAVVVAAAYLAVAIEPGDGGAVAQRHGHFARRRLAAQHVLDRAQELVDTLPAQRGHRELTGALGTDRTPALQDAALFGGQRIDLVQRLHYRGAATLLDRPDGAQHFLDVGALA